MSVSRVQPTAVRVLPATARSARAPVTSERPARNASLADADVNELIRRIQSDGDGPALDAVMQKFDWVAVTCARRMHRRGERLEDLEQVAREAVLGAIARFDVDRGVPFTSFAWATSAGVLRHYYRSRWQVRVPRGLQERHLAAVRATDELTASSCHEPSVEAVAAHMDVTRDEAILALGAGHAYRVASLDDTQSYERGGSGDRLGMLDPAIECVADRIFVEQMLASLPERYQIVLVMRYFEERTQREIGQSLGVSQVHVSRLMRAALAALREHDGVA